MHKQVGFNWDLHPDAAPVTSSVFLGFLVMCFSYHATAYNCYVILKFVNCLITFKFSYSSYLIKCLDTSAYCKLSYKGQTCKKTL